MSPAELHDDETDEEWDDSCPSGAGDHETVYTFDDGESWTMECKLCGAEWWGDWPAVGP